MLTWPSSNMNDTKVLRTMMMRTVLSSVAILLVGLVNAADTPPASPPAPLAAPTPAPPSVEARAYIVVDARTDKVLAASNATERVEPASLTKLMTAYIVFQELAAGKLKLDDTVIVSEHAWRAGGAGSGGSTTFLEVGKGAPVLDLLLGMVVQSGNDATIALAERIGGTEEVFAQIMNANAQRLHMTGTHFVNSSGLPAPDHYTTARDLAVLAEALIHDFPQDYKYFSVHEFVHNGIKQQNRNGLLEKDPTVDGLKTGHTDAAGYCLVTSSLRNDMRIISVVMGSGSFKGRENASAALLNYGFTFFETKLAVKGGTPLANSPVWKADHTPFDIGVSQDLWVTVPRNNTPITTAADIQPRLIAPLSAQATVGTLKVSMGGETLASLPLHPLKDVNQGGWWRRLVDTIRLWFTH